MKKKKEELDDDQDSTSETEDRTDPGLSAVDKTGATDISDLSEDEEVSEKPQSLIDKIKSKIVPHKKSAAADVDDDGTGVHDVKKVPKKKMNPVILVVVLVVLGIVLFYEEEPEQVAEPVLKTRPKRVKKTEAAKTETPATEPVAETPAATEPTTEPTTEEPAVAETPATEPTTEPTTEEPAVAETPVTEPTTEEPAVTETTTEPTPEPTIEEPAVSETPMEAEPASPDSVDGQVVDTDESNMTDKILEDLEKQVKKDQPKEVKKEYVSPPDYEYKGRGLVYNCAGKHWACVDAPSYKTCEDNFSSTTFKKKTIECYPFNVYDTTKSCELMQNRVVSSNAKTSFCNGN